MPALVERGRHPLRSVFKEAHAIRLFPAVCRVSHADERLKRGSQLHSAYTPEDSSRPPDRECQADTQVHCVDIDS
jgi:hypothetical protein